MMFVAIAHLRSLFSFFFNDPATTEIYTLSLHDALPISSQRAGQGRRQVDRDNRRHQLQGSGVDAASDGGIGETVGSVGDRKSTRLNSSHSQISYAVFWLKKKRQQRARRTVSHNNSLHAH